jgi:putative hydrolase of HD superfamily
MMTDSEAAGLIRLVHLAGHLKRTKRTGWVDRGMPPDEVESVADHSFRVALIAWLAAAGDPTLNRDRVLVLALIHDLAEALTGDLTPYESAEAGDVAFLNQRHIRSAERVEAKKAAEAAAIQEMTRELPSHLKEEIAELWRELEERATPEARFVKQVDKLETYLQSREYAAERLGLPVDSFAAEVAEVIDVPRLVRLRAAITDGLTAPSGAEPPGYDDEPH